jgi:hypothetical protein
MACVPGLATPLPVSTLDANAINTYILQTAEVAVRQTASVPTLTATATLRSTFTPEPTFTPIGTFIPPTQIPVSQIRYFRVKHDSQLAIYNYKSRTASKKWPVEAWGLQTPEVVPLSVGLNISLGTNRTTTDGNWGIYIEFLNNNNKQKLNYLKADNTALFDGAGFPQMESLTMGGNVITLDEMSNDWGRVHTFDYNNPGPLKDVNYSTNPDLIQKFVVVAWSRSTKATFWVNAPVGDLYWPLVSDHAVWIPMEYLEPFPSLPVDVTANETQAIRENPLTDSPLNRTELVEGKTVTVVEYFPSASDVWGQLSGGGWIKLLRGPSQYLTSWHMETQPPLPPSE